jgi:OPA family glycerol-3-phosphate transporter-like MFS transporter
MYTSIAVSKFERFGKAGFVSGVINSSVYIGSALSMYGIAVITEKFDWAGAIITWLCCSVIGLLVCIVSIRHFKKEL